MALEAYQIELTLAEKKRLPVTGFGHCVTKFVRLSKPWKISPQRYKNQLAALNVRVGTGIAAAVEK